MNNDIQKERDIMQVMRKVLTSIVREITPEHKGLQHPLSDQTIQDIRHCLALITAREKELADAAGRTAEERPHFTDEPQQSKVVSMNTIKKMDTTDKKDSED